MPTAGLSLSLSLSGVVGLEGRFELLAELCSVLCVHLLSRILDEAKRRMVQLKEKTGAVKQEVLGKEFAVSSIAESLQAVRLISIILFPSTFFSC